MGGKYGEPWRLEGTGVYRDVVNRNGACLFTENTPPVASRVVACVNACEGIQNPENIREIIDRCYVIARDIGCATLMDDIKEMLGK